MAKKTDKKHARAHSTEVKTKNASRGPKARANHKPVAGVRTAHRTGNPPLKRQMPVDEKHVAAVRIFELGLHHEQRQNYRKASKIFEKLLSNSPAEIADRARVHLRACMGRLARQRPTPKTASDYHLLGVAELNVRNLDRAIEHLSAARKLEPQHEEIRYALAAAYSLKGEREAAIEHLRAAIQLRPENRFQARHDPDFQPLAADDRFQALLGQNGHLPPRIFS